MRVLEHVLGHVGTSLSPVSPMVPWAVPWELPPHGKHVLVTLGLWVFAWVPWGSASSPLLFRLSFCSF